MVSRVEVVDDAWTPQIDLGSPDGGEKGSLRQSGVYDKRGEGFYGPDGTSSLPVDLFQLASRDYCALLPGEGGLGEGEVEIAVRHDTVTLSAGGCVKFSLTVASRITCVCWATFYLDQSAPTSEGSPTDSTCKEPYSSQWRRPARHLCILHKEGLTLYEAGGRHTVVPLPCRIRKVWPIPRGLLLERDVQAIASHASNVAVTDAIEGREHRFGDDGSLPTVFTLLHPLDEIKPLSYLSKKSGSSHEGIGHQSDHVEHSFDRIVAGDMSFLLDDFDYVTDDSLQVVFTHEEIPIVVFHSSTSRRHIFWRLREKNDPFSQKSYEKAVQITRMRNEQIKTAEQELLQQELARTGDYEAASSFAASFVIEPNSTFLDLESQIRSDVYIEWLCDDKKRDEEAAVRAFVSHDESRLPNICLLHSGVAAELRLYSFDQSYSNIRLTGSIENVESALPFHAARSSIAPAILPSAALPQVSRCCSDILVLHKPSFVPHIGIYAGDHLLSELSWAGSEQAIGIGHAVGKRFTAYLGDGRLVRLRCGSLETVPIREDITVLLSSGWMRPELWRALTKDLLSSPDFNSPESLWNDLICILKVLIYRGFGLDCETDREGESSKTASEVPDTVWEELLHSEMHRRKKLEDPLVAFLSQEIGDSFDDFGFGGSGYLSGSGEAGRELAIGSEVIQPSEASRVFQLLHILYEAYKLQPASWDRLLPLGRFLLAVSLELGWIAHADHYFRDFGACDGLSPNLKLCAHSEEEPSVLSIFRWLEDMLCADDDSENLLFDPHFAPKEYLPILCDAAPLSTLRRVCRLFAVLHGTDGSTFAKLEATEHHVHPSQGAAESKSFHGSLTSQIEAQINAGITFPLLVAGKWSGGREAGLPSVWSDGEDICDRYVRVVGTMVEEGMIADDLDSFALGIVIPLKEAISYCREHPSPSWSPAACALIGRDDIVLQYACRALPHLHATQLPAVRIPADKENASPHEADGTEFDGLISRLVFKGDDATNRLYRARDALCSAAEVTVNVEQQMGMSDHDLLALQHKELYFLVQRNMSASVGRGMITLSSSSILATEAVPVSEISLSGKIKDAKTILQLTKYPDGSALPEGMLQWPEFHAGVAAALRIGQSPAHSSSGGAEGAFSGSRTTSTAIAEQHQPQITNAWIAYNKSKEPTSKHAGFLLGLGLRGHLNVLKLPDIIAYLKVSHTPTSIGLLLGLAASKKGTMHSQFGKLFSVHIPALHPPASRDLEMAAEVQAAALLSMGMLYQGSKHRRMTEVFLDEITRPPMEDKHYDREAYAVIAGMSTGLCLLGYGRNCPDLKDINVEDKLARLINGTDAETTTTAPMVVSSSHKREEEARKSTLVLEAVGRVNTDVTASGAVLALALQYVQCNDESIAEILAIPDTVFLLECVRLDVLMLRVTSRNIVMWDAMEATEEWIDSQLPSVVKAHLQSPVGEEFTHLERETLSHVHIHVIAGACLALGLRFAGTHNRRASALLLKYLQILMDLAESKAPIGQPEFNHHLLERCVLTAALGSSLVMAGSGDQTSLEVYERLYARKDCSHLTYGSHLAVGMCIGMIYLGGGRKTLKRTPEAVAYLLCSLFPFFPSNSEDNQYHFQPLRHMYALACESRFLETRDVKTRLACSVPLKIKLKRDARGSRDYFQAPLHNDSDIVLQMDAPCLLPELSLIDSITIDGDNYWTSTLVVSDDVGERMLAASGVMYVMRRTGYLEYQSDPFGERSEYVRSFPSRPLLLPKRGTLQIRSTAKHTSSDGALSFLANKFGFVKCCSDPVLLAFAQHFCTAGNPAISEFCSSVLAECLARDEGDALSIYLGFYLAVQGLREPVRHCMEASSLRLATRCYSENSRLIRDSAGLTAMLDRGFIDSVVAAMEEYAEEVLCSSWSPLQAYLDSSTDRRDWSPLARFLQIYPLPTAKLCVPAINEASDIFALAQALPECPEDALLYLQPLLSS